MENVNTNLPFVFIDIRTDNGESRKEMNKYEMCTYSHRDRREENWLVVNCADSVGSDSLLRREEHRLVGFSNNFSTDPLISFSIV